MLHKKSTLFTSHAFAAEFGLLLGAFSWGIIWYPYRLMSEAGVSGVASSFYTYGIAIAIASIFCIRDMKKIPSISPMMVAIGLVTGWTNIAYVLAVIDGEVMRVMLLFYLSPIWTMILAHFWLKERTHLKGVGIILLALLGALLMLFDFSHADFSRDNWVSLLPIPTKSWEWLALSAGFCFALANVMTRKASHLSLRTKSFAVWFGVCVTCALMLAASNQPLPNLHMLTIKEFLMMVVIALMLIASTVLVQYGVAKVPAMRASVLFLFEIVVAAIASYFLAGETMLWNEWLGGGLILLAGILSVTQINDSH